MAARTAPTVHPRTTPDSQVLHADTETAPIAVQRSTAKLGLDVVSIGGVLTGRGAGAGFPLLSSVDRRTMSPARTRSCSHPRSAQP